MKLRIRNILILLLGILVFGTIICSNQVNATEVDQAYLESILNLIPDSMNLDISEVEYENATSKVLRNIEEILTNEGIEYTTTESEYEGNYITLKDVTFNNNNISISVFSSLYSGIREAQIGISGDSKNRKNIELVYNNSKNYNTTDESYVESLKLDTPRYFEIDIESDIGRLETVLNYYDNLINDNNIILRYASASGGGLDSDYFVGIFKNGILYDVINGYATFIPSVNVPKDIKDNELNDFVITKLNKYYKEILEAENISITGITKGVTISENIEVVNGYTVSFSDEALEQDFKYVIVNREVEVDTTDTTTNIKLETTSNVVPEGTTLAVEKITTGEKYNTVIATLGDDIDKFALYDITLKSNGVEIQPNGKVKISMPIPEGFNKEKLIVYRINEDETKVKYDVKVETIEGKEYATFETDHFSLYTLAMEKAEETTNQNATTNNNTSSNDNNKLDETPKTGNIDLIGFVSLVAVISLIAIVVLKKNNK